MNLRYEVRDFGLPIFLLVSLLLCLGATAKTPLQQRLSEAEPLFIDGEGSPQIELVSNATAEARNANQLLNYADTKHVNIQGLLRGYPIDQTERGQAYWSSDRLLKMALFDGEVVYLINKRLYQINPSVMGWIGQIIDENGSHVGTVTIEIYCNNEIRGHLHIPGRFRVEIKPIDGTVEHDVIELRFSTVKVRID